VTRPRPHTGTDRGFSLIELIAVLAVFALVATMGLQALQGTLRSRDALTDRATATRALDRGLTLLRRDLEAAVALGFTRPDGGRERALVYDPVARQLSLSVAGRGSLPDAPGAGTARVVWRFDPGTGRLDRAVWPTLIPAGAAAAGPAHPALDGLSGFQVAYHLPRDGWTEAAPDQDFGETGGLPRAVEIRMIHDRLGPLTVTVRP